jgi:tRNA (guanine37-N1)-methyltransferase
MRIDVLTLFPEMFAGVIGQSIIRRACDKGLLEIALTNFRDFATDKHRSVDDKPFGGGPGMVLMCQPLFDAVEAVSKQGEPPDEVILTTPQGAKFDQATARELAGTKRLILIAGHYEGVDERIRTHLATREISIGDYVLTGGELPAMVIIDAIARLLPGALGDEQSPVEESFSGGLLEYPQYTRPAEYRGWTVPDVLVSGNHEVIRCWRLEQAKQRTMQRRPDLCGEETNFVKPPMDADKHR